MYGQKINKFKVKKYILFLLISILSPNLWAQEETHYEIIQRENDWQVELYHQDELYETRKFQTYKDALDFSVTIAGWPHIADVEKSIIHHQAEVSLQGPCTWVNFQLYAIRQWSIQRGHFGEIPEVNTVSPRQCRVVLNSLLTPLVNRINHTRSPCDGPNCWNTTLTVSGLNEVLRFTSSQEFAGVLESQRCQEISYAHRRPGDIVRLRDDNHEIHGLIYISDDLCFSKNGSSQRSKYDIQSTADVLSRYEVLPPCDQGRGNKCTKYAQYYRCQSSDYQLPYSSELAPISEQLEHLECEVSNLVFTQSNPIDSKLIHLLRQSLQIVDHTLINIEEQLKSKNPLPKDQLNEVSLLKAKVRSLQDQISLYNWPTRVEKRTL